MERLGQDIGREAVDLRVQLEGRHELRCAGHLEVHVPEGVLGSEYVGKGRVDALGVDEPHRDPRDGRLDRHPGIHQRQRRAAHRGHRGRAVRGEHFRDEPQHVGELALRRYDGEQGSLGQESVADLAAFRPSHEAGLTGRERGEVVVVHVAFGVVDADRVQHLVHAGHAEGREIEDLGVAALEEARAMGRGDDTDLSRQGPDVGGATAIDAHAL